MPERIAKLCTHGLSDNCTIEGRQVVESWKIGEGGERRTDYTYRCHEHGEHLGHFKMIEKLK